MSHVQKVSPNNNSTLYNVQIFFFFNYICASCTLYSVTSYASVQIDGVHNKQCIQAYRHDMTDMKKS